jgi:hypothetical protein
MFPPDVADDVVSVTISGFPSPPHAPSMDFNVSINGTQTLSYPIVNNNQLGNDLVIFEVMLSSSEATVEAFLNTASVNITEDDSKTSIA